jgi:hypothetical protein
MIHVSSCSRAAARLERDAREVIVMRSIFTTLAIAAAAVSALAITPPALAGSGSGAGGPVGASNSAGSGAPSHSATRAPNATGSAAHRSSSTGASPQVSNPTHGEGWHHGSTPPGWTGHGEKRGWDGGKMPPGLSHRDHDRDLRSDHHWGDERGDHEHAPFHTGQPERRWVGDWGYARKSQ